jgi:hypothetical protein
LVKSVLVGLGSRACHMIDDFVYYNSILAIGDNGRTIGCNWRVNRDFLKFRGGLKKW